MKFKLVIKGKNPYDLSRMKWVCVNCGGQKRPPSPYELGGMIKYCWCDKKCK